MNPFGLSKSLIQAAQDVHAEGTSPDKNVPKVPVKGNSPDVNLRKREKEISGSHRANVKANVQKEEAVAEALKGGQKKLDKNHNGKLDSQDFKMLRKEETVPFEGPYEKKGEAKTKNVAKNAARKALKKVKSSMDKVKTGSSVREEVEQIDEISLKKKIHAYAATQHPDADYNYGDKVHDQGDRIKAAIVKKHGAEAGKHADAHAHSDAYGRSEPGKTARDYFKRDKLKDARPSSDMRKTSAGKIHKQDVASKKAEIKSRMKEEVQFSPEELERIEAIVGTNK